MMPTILQQLVALSIYKMIQAHQHPTGIEINNNNSYVM